MTLSTPQAIAIYEVYPRKVGKPVALQKIQAAIAKHGADFVLERTKKYAERWKELGTPMDKIPHPSTFFHQERFDDDLEAALPLPAARVNGHAPTVPIWQQIKATEALLETNRVALLKTPLPDQFHYTWKDGKSAAYDRDYKQAFEKRQALKQHRDTLNKRLAELREKLCA